MKSGRGRRAGGEVAGCAGLRWLRAEGEGRERKGRGQEVNRCTGHGSAPVGAARLRSGLGFALLCSSRPALAGRLRSAQRL